MPGSSSSTGRCHAAQTGFEVEHGIDEMVEIVQQYPTKESEGIERLRWTMVEQTKMALDEFPT